MTYDMLGRYDMNKLRERKEGSDYNAFLFHILSAKII